MIRISPIRLIGADNQQIGVIDTDEARRMAAELGLDLVEIQPDMRPPVCKIMDYGKFRYEESKREQKSRKNSKAGELKEIRLGRSVKIDPHDVQIRIDQARRFLMAGAKVQVTQRFRGREMMYREQGLDRLRTVRDQLADIAKVEMTPRWVGKQTSIVLAPDRDRIASIKRKMTSEELAKEQAALEAAEEARLAQLAEDEAEGEAEGEDAAAMEAELQAEIEKHLAEFDEEEATITREEAVKQATKKAKKELKKGPADDRAKDPVADELDDLLG